MRATTALQYSNVPSIRARSTAEDRNGVWADRSPAPSSPVGDAGFEIGEPSAAGAWAVPSSRPTASGAGGEGVPRDGGSSLSSNALRTVSSISEMRAGAPTESSTVPAPVAKSYLALTWSVSSNVTSAARTTDAGRRRAPPADSMPLCASSCDFSAASRQPLSGPGARPQSLLAKAEIAPRCLRATAAPTPAPTPRRGHGRSRVRRALTDRLRLHCAEIRRPKSRRAETQFGFADR